MKRQIMKRLTGIAMAVVFAVTALAGCGKADQITAVSEETQEAVIPEDQDLKIDYTSVENLEVEPGTYVAVVVKGLGENTYWEIVRRGVEAAVADVNAANDFQGDRQLRITFEGPAEETNEEEQINTLDTVLTEDPSALCLAAVDSESCQAQLEAARDNGIPVLILDAGIESDLITAVCQTDNRSAGEMAGKKLCEKLGGKGKVALISHQPGTETCILRTEGFYKALEEYPDIEVVCELEEQEDVSMEEQLLAMKEKYPDLDGIFATNESNTESVLTVYKEAQMPVLIGFDNGEMQIQAIRDGLEYGAICQNPYSMGYAVIIAALHAVNGEKIDPQIDSGYMWIDKDNIDDPENQIYLYQ